MKHFVAYFPSKCEQEMLLQLFCAGNPIFSEVWKISNFATMMSVDVMRAEGGGSSFSFFDDSFPRINGAPTKDNVLHDLAKFAPEIVSKLRL